MNYSFLVAICAALSLVGASPLGAPSTIPGLIGRELGLRAAPGCSVGSCGGQIPNNVVCCTGWACINASAGGVSAYTSLSAETHLQPFYSRHVSSSSAEITKLTKVRSSARKMSRNVLNGARTLRARRNEASCGCRRPAMRRIAGSREKLPWEIRGRMYVRWGIYVVGVVVGTIEKHTLLLSEVIVHSCVEVYEVRFKHN
ncbi:hypothetical protein HGRIS_003079 [Hohenbuehelia grisea]|uniref:Hydrophobin n=1 Tax=Hohenbuehelia grisea TaxID=104357 RepID=A0ABR3JN53_9AGAR